MTFIQSFLQHQSTAVLEKASQKQRAKSVHQDHHMSIIFDWFQKHQTSKLYEKNRREKSTQISLLSMINILQTKDSQCTKTKTNTHLDIHTHVLAPRNKHTHTYTQFYTHTHTHTHINSYIYRYTLTYTYADSYANIHTHRQTCRQSDRDRQIDISARPIIED